MGQGGVAHRRRGVRELVLSILAAPPGLDERTAERIAQQLHERERPVSAREVARYVGLRKTDWVYANAERLGGRRLGEGKRPRWRFYLSEVEDRLHDFGATPAPRPISRPEPKPRRPRRGERRKGAHHGGERAARLRGGVSRLPCPTWVGPRAFGSAPSCWPTAG